MVVVPRLQDPTCSPDDQLQVLLVDRRPLFLAALGELIKSAFPGARISTVTRSDQALSRAAERPIDLVFCEVGAQPLAGLELAARIGAAGLKTRVILLGDHEDQQLLVGSLACGAAGFFTKDASPEEFLDGVRAVLAGHYVVGRNLLQHSLSRLAGKGRSDSTWQLGQLSEAERSILILLGKAQSTRAIAASRGISQKTVRNHLASIYRKLEVRNRSEAIVWSARAGLTEVIAES
jgi:DNA-binding NarL/FixJ family response regulator